MNHLEKIKKMGKNTSANIWPVEDKQDVAS
jgi:hypothetical protein